MAISITSSNRGTNTEKTSDATLTLTPSGNLAAGSYGVIAIVTDNPSTTQGSTTYYTVTSTGGRTWTRLREQSQGASALAGVTSGLFMAYLPHGLTTAESISIAISANATAKGCGLMELACAAGQTIVQSVSGENGSNYSGTSYSVALSSLTNVAGLYIGMCGAEDEVDTACTLDGAYTATSFGSIGSGTAGTPQSNVRARVGTLANTSAGDTFDASPTTTGDKAVVIVRLEESPLKVLPEVVAPVPFTAGHLDNYRGDSF